MHIKIYFGDKPVYLCNELSIELQEILHHPDAVFVDEISVSAVKSLLHEIKKEAFHAGVMCHADFEKLKSVFFKQFNVIEAAGGIVQNSAKEILFIKRLGKWDLPKGKMEKGENQEECAVREVEEETGVSNLNLKKKIGVTYHTYDLFGKHNLKITYWYSMVCAKGKNTIPQIEEDITEVKWIADKDVTAIMTNTYPSIKDILSSFFNEMQEINN
jgi:8-oxo-dGTP pyrophosphatase MutT (NUDIX family)